MNALSHYAPLFDESEKGAASVYAAEALGHMTSGDQEWFSNEITKLASDLMQDEETYGDLMAALEQMDSLDHLGAQAVLEKVAEASVVPYETPLIKEASRMERAKAGAREVLQSPWAAPVAGAALATGTMAGKALSSYLKRRALMKKGRETYKQVLARNPHLKADPSMPNYFDTIARFAPHVAADRVLLENTLNHIQSTGPQALSMASVKAMSDVSRGAVTPTSDPTNGVGTAAKAGYHGAKGLSTILAAPRFNQKTF